VEHTLREILKQRIYGLACGYEDANDAARLRKDPIHKMLLGRDPVKGLDLASQSTLSRFENAAGPRTLYRMGMSLAEAVMPRHEKRLGGHARLVTIDLAPTDTDTFGGQQLSFFNTHYDNWCYLPMMGFVRVTTPLKAGPTAIVGTAPRPWLHGNAKGVVNIAFEFMEFGVLPSFIHTFRTKTYKLLSCNKLVIIPRVSFHP